MVATEPAVPPLPDAEDPGDLPAPRRSVPQSYDRTWELELLISGAVAFTLLQLPGVADAAFDRLSPRLGEGLHRVLMFGYIYSKIILYALIATFIVHLAARAYWVGLVGLSSVFPNGIRWEELKYGPVTREFYRERLPTLQAQVATVDRFCSILFSFATIIVLTFVSSTIFVTALGGLAWFVSNRVLDRANDLIVFYAMMALLVIPMIIATQLDKRRGERLGARGRRSIRRVVWGMYATQFGSLTSTISNTLFSNLNRTKAVGTFYLAFVGLMGFFIVRDVMIRLDGNSLDSYQYLPDVEGRSTVAFRYYEDQRPAGLVDARSPSIQSDIIRDPYVRLFLPYFPRRHNYLMLERCPETVAALESAEGDARRAADQALLDCVAAIQPISLNGMPLRPRLHHYTRPESGIRGMIAYLPTAGLPAGENLLVIEAIPRPQRNLDDDDEPADPHFIPFWVASPGGASVGPTAAPAMDTSAAMR